MLLLAPAVRNEANISSNYINPTPRRWGIAHPYIDVEI